jgi:hypothetical protein
MHVVLFLPVCIEKNYMKNHQQKQNPSWDLKKQPFHNLCLEIKSETLPTVLFNFNIMSYD